MDKALFISIEGCDGSGKTTALNAVYQRLVSQGYDVVRSREPGGSAIAEQIRRVILDPANTAEDVRTEALLYAASRRQHLIEVVLPALKAGHTVLCDRFIDSSLAYQGFARGIGIDAVMQVNQFAIEGRMPDRTIYFDIDPAVGLRRLAGRSALDRLDQEKLAFHQKVHQGYAQIIAADPGRFIIIDAAPAPAAVAQAAYQAIAGLLEHHV